MTTPGTVIFFVSVGLIKVSICLFHRRLLSQTSRVWDILNNAFLALLAAFVVVSAFTHGFRCDPPAAAFDLLERGRVDQPAQCGAWIDTVRIVLSVVHVVMDFVLLLPPIYVLWKVRMPRTTKIRLFVVFSLGTISCLGAIMRSISQATMTLDATCEFPSNGYDQWSFMIYRARRT